jgi:acyl carrier protein
MSTQVSERPDEAAVLAAVTRMISDVVGEDYLLDIEVTMETSFTDDLEIESIEFVALAERLTEAYGQQVDFAGWLADMELDEIITISVGELVDYICDCLDSTSAVGSGDESPHQQ